MTAAMKKSRGILGPCAILLLVPSGALFAAEADEAGGTVEEVIVTAQRVAESIQDVPISVTALTSDAIEDRQVITTSDLPLRASNVTFTATNFGGSSFSIRGVGNLVIARSGEPGVSQHLNEIAVVTNLNTFEFFDMERVEILRGPQGTLFGRNATGGAINFVTRKPDMGEVNGFVDFELGDYEHTRSKGALNLPLGDRVGVRLAGFQLDREGYIENLAYGQVSTRGETLSGIKDSVDGRNILSYRATIAWEINDNAKAWGLYSRFEEDDDRARITNQVCEQNALPTTGCTPDGFGWDSPHIGSTTAGIFGGAAGALPFGTVDGVHDYPRPAISGFRQMHTDFQPILRNDEEILAFGVEFDVGELSATVSGARRESDYVSQQDYTMDVGALLGPTPQNPAGIWPTSRPAGGAGEEWLSDQCNILEGTSGIRGGCRLGVAQNRVFAFDQLDGVSENWTVEAKVHSNYDGPINFLAGATTYENFAYGGYYVLANTLDLVGTYGSSVLRAPPLYPNFFFNANDPVEGTVSNGWAAFGEVYYDYSDRIKLTGGLRFNKDDKSTNDTSVLFNSADANGALGGLFGADPIWLRSGMFGEMVAIASGTATSLSTTSMRILEFHGAEGTYATHGPAAIGGIVALGAAQQIGQLVATGQLPPQLVPVILGTLGLPPLFQNSVLALLSQNPVAIAADPGLQAAGAGMRAIASAVGPAPAFGETRFVTGSPTSSGWREVSGRLGFDYQLDDDTLIYGFFSRGYKPGGFNPPIPPQFQDSTPFTFEAEQVNALEVGAKTTRMDGRLVLNAAGFIYDYTGLQATRIRNNTSINENIDASILGLEAEGTWRPEEMPALAVDFAYGWLNTSVEGSQSIDPIERTAGNSAYITLKNIDPGSTTGVNYVAQESQLTAALVAAALASGAALDVRNGLTQESVSYPANSAGVSIPAYFSRGFLDAMGVETLEGVPVDLDGNSLPNAPEHTLRLGLAYTFQVGAGSLIARWDAYWQSDSYAREFNTIGDEIDSWMQHNMSLIYEREGWSAKFWMRNVFDDENVTGKYLTSDTSGFFRNYFVTEPRIFGISVRRSFGD
ncbi:MAG: TonB-dependent receptor [Gammaproteobacteria bacterium]|nr:TonB-dependent receptor [Gammaproteobacteria bacterium]